jgi:hypothetical protein
MISISSSGLMEGKRIRRATAAIAGVSCQAWAAALILLCLGALWLEFRHIDHTMPYPRMVDEPFIAEPAHHILVTGTLHPSRFFWPSLPNYLAAGGMAIGFFRSAARLEISKVEEIGNIGYPYYHTRAVMQSARQLFSVLSVIALAATGFAGWVAFRKPVAILLAPVSLLASPLFFSDSWSYLNVDIVGTCFVVLTITACLLGTRRPSIHQSAIVPAAFAGLATGSKYPLALVILPVLLAIGFYFTGARRIWACIAALATMVATFVAVVPYSLIDIPAFLNGVASEFYHFASGHYEYTGDPGFPQLLYYARHFVSEFGVSGTILALLGVWAYAAIDWRRAAVLISFPVGLLWLLACQRVHFTREVLSLYPLVAMFVSFGVISLYGWALALAFRKWGAQKVDGRACVVIGLTLLLAAVPVWHLRDDFRDRTDSRNLAAGWIEKWLPQSWTIVIPKQLGFDTRGLEARGRRVVVVDLQSVRDDGALQVLLNGLPKPAVIMVPRWGADLWFPGQGSPGVPNDLSRQWRVMKTFGTNDVIVNISNPVRPGDPAFSVAALK